MSPDDIRRIVIQTLGEVAPEVDFGRVRPDRPLRDQLDIDSYDFLSVVVALHDRLGIDIPESDYHRLGTLDSTTEYFAARLPEPNP